MSGHYLCCCRTCNPLDTERPECGTCIPHGPDPEDTTEEGSAPTEYDVYAEPFVPQPEPEKMRVVNRPDEAVE